MSVSSAIGITPRQILLIAMAAILFALVAAHVSNTPVFGSFGAISFAVGIPIAGLIIVKPFWGLLLVIVINQIDSLVAVPYFSSIGRLCGVFVGLGWLIKYFFRRTLLFELMRFNGVLLLFIISMGASSFFAVYPGPSIANSLTITLLVLMVFFLEDFIHDRKMLNIFLLTMALSIGISSFFGIIQYEDLMKGQETIGTIGIEDQGQTERVAGLTLNPNGYAVILMSGIPLLLFYILNATGRHLKLIALLLFLTSVVSLGLTMSRTNIIGLGVFLCAFFALSAGYKTITSVRLLILCAVLAVLLVISYVFLFDVIMTRSFSFDDGSSDLRFQMMKKGLALLIKHPFFGIGFGNLEMIADSSREYNAILERPGHDILSVPFVSTGLFGTTVLLVMVCMTFRNFAIALRAFAKHGEKQLLGLGIAVESGLIALLSTCFGNPIIFQRIFWIYVALGIILWRWSRPNFEVQLSVQQRARSIQSAVMESRTARNRFRVKSKLVS